VSRHGTAAAAKRGAPATRSRPEALVGFVGRLMFAQAGASAAVSLGYSRRSGPSMLLAILVAVVVCGLAVLVRSGAHTAWLVAVTFEAGFVGVGLFQFAYTPYLGGTLLAIIALGTLLHPAVARVFAGWRPLPERSGLAGPALAEGSSDLVAGRAVS
jgi:hypothetical protein